MSAPAAAPAPTPAPAVAAAEPEAPTASEPAVRRASAGLTPRRAALLVVAAVLAGLALRMAIALTDDAPSTDETAYLRSGASLAAGDGFSRDGEPELHFPPLVPFLLGGTARLVGDPHTATVVLTCLSSTLLIVPLARLGRRLGGEAAGVATAWIAALAPGISTTLVTRGAGSEAEYMLLVVTAIWLVVAAGDHSGRRRLARVAGAGLMVGLAYLTRPEGLFMAVPLGAAVLVLARREAAERARADTRTARGTSAATDAGTASRATSRRPGLATVVPALAAFAVPIAACVAPYAAYQHAHTGTWQLSAKTQDASVEAWHAVARGDRESRDRVLYGLDETGLAFSTERTSFLGLARDDPGGVLAIVGTNVATLAGAIASPLGGGVLAWALLPLPLWALAGYGAWRHRRSGTLRLVLAAGALPVATTLVFFVHARYLVLTAALATVAAGAGLVALPARWRRPSAVAAVVLLALSSVQAFRGPAGWWHPGDQLDQQAAGEWIAAHAAPGDRVMSRSMVVEFYADRPTMAIPYADLDEILAFGEHYGARYLVVDDYTVRRLRPQLAPLREGERVPGLRLVYEVRREGRTTRVFAFDPPPAVPQEMGPPLGFIGDS